MSGFYWLVSYPKSGNTWLRLLLNSYRNDGAEPDFSERLDFSPIASGRRRFDQLLGIASSDLLPEEILALRPRVYELQLLETRAPLFNKVHDAWRLTPAGEPLFPASVTLGAVYIVRDPRDVVLSLAGHLGCDVDQSINFVLSELSTLCEQKMRLRDQLPQLLGSWSQHVLSWIDLPAPWQPLLVRYEDMLAQPLDALARIISHCGWPLDGGCLERAVAATRFERLRASEAVHGFRERPSGSVGFFRAGQAGGWRDQLTDSQRRRVEAATEEVRSRLGYT